MGNYTCDIYKDKPVLQYFSCLSGAKLLGVLT